MNLCSMNAIKLIYLHEILLCSKQPVPQHFVFNMANFGTRSFVLKDNVQVYGMHPNIYKPKLNRSQTLKHLSRIVFVFCFFFLEKIAF